MRNMFTLETTLGYAVKMHHHKDVVKLNHKALSKIVADDIFFF